MGLHTRQMAPFLEFVLQISESHGWVKIVCLYHVSFIQEEDKETESHKEDHSEARALQCKTCDKWLSNKVKLNSHIRTHTGERPFQCDFCPLSFLSESTMSAHRQDKHPADWEANKDEIKTFFTECFC